MTRSALLVLVGTVFLAASLLGQGRGQDQAPYPRLPAPPVKSPPDTTAPDIPGVVAGGTKVHLIRDLFQSTEGPIAMPDGSLLFTEQDAAATGSWSRSTTTAMSPRSSPTRTGRSVSRTTRKDV
jgi:hypothetical protein